MIFLFGVQVVKTPVPNGLIVRRQCDRCGFISDLQEYHARNFFTLFFLPIFPLSKGQEILVCSRCGAEFPLLVEDYLAAGREVPISFLHARAKAQLESVVIACRFCQGKLRLPHNDKRMLVTCPHCREQFNYAPK